MKQLLSVVVFTLVSVAAFGAKASEGHYEMRYENVVVSYGHYERYWVAGFPGHYQSYWVAPRYATRQVSVFVPNYRPASSSGNSSTTIVNNFNLNASFDSGLKDAAKAADDLIKVVFKP